MEVCATTVYAALEKTSHHRSVSLEWMLVSVAYNLKRLHQMTMMV